MLAVKVLAKSMDTTVPDVTKFEIGVVCKEDGKLVQKRVEGAELKAILEEAKVFDK